MIGKTLSHYTILEKLGEGGMGVVYKARDTRLDRVVALKFLPLSLVSSAGDVQRFEQEARAISSLNDSHIATIHDIDEADGQRFLVLEYLPGGTLKDKLRELQSAGHELPVSDVIAYGVQIAEGLAHAHRRGIVHRDVKTDNVMLTEGGEVKITDFGLAKLKGGPLLTQKGSTIGTAAYMSPEQIRGEEIDRRSDLFSFGVVMYELATGVLPYRGEHEAALAYSIANEQAVDPRKLRPALPDSLTQLILRCLEKDPAKRFQTAEEITAELRRMRGDSMPPPAPAPRKVPRWAFIAAAAAVVVAALLLFIPSSSTRVDRKSIAVLPFTNLSGSHEDEYFSDGMTEDIITQLCKVGDLRVISPASVMQFKSANRSTRDIARELNVATVLEGSIRREGSRVHITAHLIDATTDDHLWAETYDADMSQIFTIQSDVAQKIAGALKAALSPAEKQQIEKKPTQSLEAYARYLEGREYYGHYQKQDNERAITLFKEALASDPRYALAYAGLGDAYGQRVQKFGYSPTWNDSSIAMSYRALSIDSTLAEGYKALGLGFGEKGWMQKALEMVHKAIQENPNFSPAVANIGWGNWIIGRFDEAYPWMMRAKALDPTLAYQSFGMGMLYVRLNDSVKATECFNRGLQLQRDFTYSHLGLAILQFDRRNFELAAREAQSILSNAPDDVHALMLAGETALASGAPADAERYLKKAEAQAPGGELFFLFRRQGTSLGYVYHSSGRRTDAEKLFTRNLQLDRTDLSHGVETSLAPYDIARISAVRGERDDALNWLQKAIDAGWREYQFCAIDPLMANVRTDPRFDAMMAQLKTSVEMMRGRVEELEKKSQTESFTHGN